jgi:hypothetical protein
VKVVENGYKVLVTTRITVYPSVGVRASRPGHRVRQAPDQRPGPEKKNALAHELVWEIVTAY